MFLGTGESFLFSFSPHFHVYKWTRANEDFQNGDSTRIYIGGSGNTGSHSSSRLRPSQIIDASSSTQPEEFTPSSCGLMVDLVEGTSGTCETYLNRALASTKDFEVRSLELWSFVVNV